MKTLFLVLLFALFFCPEANAAPHPAPAALQGVWSSPDCTAADKVWVISRYFYIHTAPGDVSVGSVAGWQQDEGKEDRYYHLDTGKTDSIIINLTNDGLMRTVEIAADNSALSGQWAQLQEGEDFSPQEYSHCAKLFDKRPALGQREVNSIFLLDQITEKCVGATPQNFSTARQCHKTLFYLLDANADGSLGRDELAGLHRQLEFLQAGTQACPGVAGFYPSGLNDSLAFADSILAQMKGRTSFADLSAKLRAGDVDLSALPLRGLNVFMPFVAGPATGCTPPAAAGLPQKNAGASPKRDDPLYPALIRP